MTENPSRTEREKMLGGELYRGSDPDLTLARTRANELLCLLNATPESSSERRSKLLHDLLGSFGSDAVIRSPFSCDYGTNIEVGEGVFANYGCIFLDVGRIVIGELTQIGTGVQLVTADHPRDPELRRAGLESAKPVNIGRNVWIGSGAIILPGVTVGDDAIIGAGSVVTRDVRAGATVAGNPARELKNARGAPEATS